MSNKLGILFAAIAITLNLGFCFNKQQDSSLDWLPKISTFSEGPDLSREYAAINSLLEKQTKSDEAKENFDKIRHWLKSWHLVRLSKEQLDAARLFISLAKLNKLNQCNLDSFNILHANYIAANSIAHFGKKHLASSNHRINTIIGKFIDQYTSDCLDSYFDLYRKQMEQVGSEIKESVEGLVKNVIFELYGKGRGKIVLNNQDELLNFVKIYPIIYLAIIDNNNYLLNELKNSNSNDWNEKSIMKPVELDWLGNKVKQVDRFKLQSLYDKYIYKPCKEYILKLEIVFKPIDFGTRTLKVPVKSGEQLDFYLNWATFELCNTLTFYKDVLIENMANYVDRIAAEKMKRQLVNSVRYDRT